MDGEVSPNAFAESGRLVRVHIGMWEWSPRSSFPERKVGKCGSARYSSLSVRLAGNSGGTAENVDFRPESLDLGRFFFERSSL